MTRFKKNKFLFSLACLVILALPACSSAVATPRVIAAAYQTPIAIYPTQPPPVEQIITVDYLDLELSVWDVQSASTAVFQSLESNGGYLVTSQSWQENNQQIECLVLAVPNVNAAHFKSDLLQLGIPLAKTDTIYTSTCQSCQPYARINLVLRSRSMLESRPPAVPGWDPLNTLHSASRVFVTIFSFFIDIGIWVVVVAGPFGLLGYIGFLLVKHWQRRNGSGKDTQKLIYQAGFE